AHIVTSNMSTKESAPAYAPASSTSPTSTPLRRTAGEANIEDPPVRSLPAAPAPAPASAVSLLTRDMANTPST
ncbi:hypothetical protein A4X13_0g8903, partial [Tilletia indica]